MDMAKCRLLGYSVLYVTKLFISAKDKGAEVKEE
jgi:hypothetical protein